MKEVVDWAYGPQIMGLILLIFGFIQKAWPPKKINGYYGYSSPAAETNMEVWTEANRFAPLVMIRLGLILIIAGLALTAVVKFIPALAGVKTLTGMLGLAIGAFVGGLVMRNKTERHLREKFDLETE